MWEWPGEEANITIMYYLVICTEYVFAITCTTELFHQERKGSVLFLYHYTVFMLIDLEI